MDGRNPSPQGESPGPERRPAFPRRGGGVIKGKSPIPRGHKRNFARQSRRPGETDRETSETRSRRTRWSAGAGGGKRGGQYETRLDEAGGGGAVGRAG